MIDRLLALDAPPVVLDAGFVRASVESDARAIVLEGTGRGNANEQVVEGVRETVAAGVPVARGCARSGVSAGGRGRVACAL